MAELDCISAGQPEEGASTQHIVLIVIALNKQRWLVNYELSLQYAQNYTSTQSSEQFICKTQYNNRTAEVLIYIQATMVFFFFSLSRAFKRVTRQEIRT